MISRKVSGGVNWKKKEVKIAITYILGEKNMK